MLVMSWEVQKVGHNNAKGGKTWIHSIVTPPLANGS